MILKSLKATSDTSSSGEFSIFLYIYNRIIRLFLEGKGFPNGFLSAEKHRHHVYDIVNILCEVETLEEMIQIDSEVFFTIFAKLFTGAPLKYLAT
jgi:hypothetical protein